MTYPTAAGQAPPEEIVIGNEFSLVVVKKVHTRNGERLSIRCPRAGTQVELDPLELESLTWQAPEAISRFLESPRAHGRPDPPSEGRPLSLLVTTTEGEKHGSA